MKVVKCMFCRKTTTSIRSNIKKKINGKSITLTNAPVHFCSQCNETFVSKEAQDVLSFIRDRGLDQKNIIFSYDEIAK